ncbi:MAG: GntR family transcriptional regulator [Clostridia bacterium]|nr:GntR family transcriptional regulator [Clostridia bacterium]MBQ6475781.1 GntR family transcriptional regulator [Clostridia bacterium]MBR0445575.1 GntR family transcriptional regulator [Clostridia bacterium]MCR5073959.1 GntR family transcriptional regulator [Clostridiales bacterium]
MTDSKINARSPLYLQLREVIRNKIESGEYPPGTAIPSENTLAETYGIHRLSVRSAISSLIYEGLLKSVQGKGVFVNGEKDLRDMEIIGGFKQTMRQLGHTSSTRIIAKATRNAGPYYSRRLGIDSEDPIFYIKRVCYAEDEPYSLEEIYIPQTIIKTLPQVDLELYSLYDIYEFYGIRVSRVEQTLEIEELDQGDARLLDVDSSFAVMKFRGTSFDQFGRIVEYARTYTRGDRCIYQVHYERE